MSYIPYSKNPSGIIFFGSSVSDSLLTSDTKLSFDLNNGRLLVSGIPVSVSGHNHSSSDITNFASSLSGLLPVKDIIAGSNMEVISNSGQYTISATGLQASGNYSIVGHTHIPEDIFSSITWTGDYNNFVTYAPNQAVRFGDSIWVMHTFIGAAGYAPESTHWTKIGELTTLSYQITDFNTTVSGLLPVKNIVSGDYISITSNLGEYTISVIGLQPSGSYSTTGHQHVSSDITDFSSSVSGLLIPYALLNSPNFSGVPTVPTASSGTNTNQIASTAFVRTEISNLIDSAPNTLDTLNELAAALGDDANFSTTIINSLANKANLSGATFTGTITGPSGDFVVLKQNGTVVSVSGHAHSSTDITNFNNSVSGLLPLVTGVGYINTTFTNNTYSISATGLQPSGNYSLVGHSHISSDVTDFNSSVSGLLPVKNISAGNYISVTPVSGDFTISATGLQPSGNYSIVGHTHTSSNITDFSSSVSGLLPSISGSGYVISSFENNIYNISVSGLQPSGNYSIVGHTHNASDITDFNSSVSGLLPVKNILSGSGISVSSTSGIYTINSTLSLEDIQDNLGNEFLIEGTGVQLSYSDSGNILTINNTHTEINELSLEPQGFINRLDSIISFNDSTRTFTIAPSGSSYDLYIEGIKVTKTTSESVVIPSGTALNYIHFDTSTYQLQTKNTSFNFDTDVPIAFIHWNSDINQSTFFGEERHGIRMDSTTHRWIHNTFGVQYIDGLSIGGYTLLGNGSLDSHAQISISDGTLYQEDIIINIADGNDGVEFTQQLTPIAYIPVYYHSGSTGQWVRDSGTPYPLKYNATRAMYNLYSGGTWTTPNVTNNRYFAMWLVATNDINDPILTIMGQREDSSLGSAENNNNWSDINLTNIPTNELRPLYRLIFVTNDTFTNTPKSSLQSILDIRRTIVTPTNAVVQNDHGSLFGLGDDDHFQYVHINEARTISANHTFNNGLTISSGLLSATNGNFTSLSVNNTGVSISGHTHVATDITNFNSSVSGLLPVKDILAGTNISVSSVSGAYTVSVSGSLGLTEEQVDDRVSNLLTAGTGITLNYDDNGNSLTIATSGLQPSGDYSLNGHTHTASNITDFNSSVSGLLPVKDIIAGTNISVSSSSGSYTVSVSGSLGLTEEQVDDRVSNLLVAGTGITLTYDDNGNTLTIATSGLQPSGNYSLTGHTHSGSDITSGTIADARLSTNAQSAINLYLWSSFR